MFFIKKLLIKKEKYDLTTVQGINAIPSNCYTNVDKKPMYYALQRKATEYKKNGNMELAIACLRKSNEISDTYERPPLLASDYFRLVKYLQKAGRNNEANIEEMNLHRKHPEFFDKRIGNKKRLLEEISKAKVYNTDLVFLATNSKCSICKQYNNKIFSISGKSKKYPKLPNEFLNLGGFDKDCILGISLHFEENNK